MDEGQPMNLQQQMKQLEQTFRQDDLKSLRAYTHTAFDKIWKEEGYTRTEAYELLAEVMGLSTKKAHIALFTKAQCHTLLDWLSENENNNPHGLVWADQF
jgi:hypothetical protein